MDFNEIFQVTSTAEGYIITSGAHRVSEEIYDEDYKAQDAIDRRDWNCVAFLAYSLANLSIDARLKDLKESDNLFKKNDE